MISIILIQTVNPPKCISFWECCQLPHVLTSWEKWQLCFAGDSSGVTLVWFRIAALCRNLSFSWALWGQVKFSLQRQNFVFLHGNDFIYPAWGLKHLPDFPAGGHTITAYSSCALNLFCSCKIQEETVRRPEQAFCFIKPCVWVSRSRSHFFWWCQGFQTENSLGWIED